ncbi:hypothetical protein F5887DRAFT_1256268 [Amanita rubescens]|nr:hypothetical protein F5887DRAFT_1256268 [Amanita rubescens]
MGPAPPQWLLELMGIAPPQWLTQFIGNVHQIQATNSNCPTRSTIAGLNPGQLDAYCDGYVGVGHGLVGVAGQTAIAQVIGCTFTPSLPTIPMAGTATKATINLNETLDHSPGCCLLYVIHPRKTAAMQGAA